MRYFDGGSQQLQVLVIDVGVVVVVAVVLAVIISFGSKTQLFWFKTLLIFAEVFAGHHSQ